MVDIKAIASKYWLPICGVGLIAVSALPSVVGRLMASDTVSYDDLYDGVIAVHERLDEVEASVQQSQAPLVASQQLTDAAAIDYLAVHQAHGNVLEDAIAQHLAAIVQNQYMEIYKATQTNGTTFEWELAARQKALLNSLEYLANKTNGVISPIDGGDRDQMSDLLMSLKAQQMLVALIAEGKTPSPTIFNASDMLSSSSSYTDELYRLAQQNIQLSSVGRAHQRQQEDYEATLEEGENANADTDLQ